MVQLNDVIKGTSMIGMSVKNLEGRALAKIKELAVNSSASGLIITGKVEYPVLKLESDKFQLPLQ